MGLDFKDMGKLLDRDEIQWDFVRAAGFLEGKRVLVTGGAGSIGSEVCRQLMKMPVSAVGVFDNAESPLHYIREELSALRDAPRLFFQLGDVRNKACLRHVFEKFRPDVVVHAAAYKHVPLMEEFPCEGVGVNVLGTRNVADMAVKYGVGRFVMVSTDKAVNPANVMGATKRLAEIYVQSLGKEIESGRISGNTMMVTTRFGNVLASQGSVVPLFVKQLKEGNTVTVTDKRMTRYFMTIPEAVGLLLESLAIAEGSAIYLFDMGAPLRIVDLVRKIGKLMGHEEVRIRSIGVRKGEKLYEEILASGENSVPTGHPYILGARVRDYSYGEVSEIMDNIGQACHSYDSKSVDRILHEAVPEFKFREDGN